MGNLGESQPSRIRFRARYRRILLFFAPVFFSFAVWEVVLPRLGLRKWVQKTRGQRLTKAAHQFRLLAIQMGGVMIKVGQFFSARVDVLPREITAELSGLQDEVPPVPYDDIRQVAEAEFQAPLETMFAHFERQPLAAASLGQVHKAVLRLEPAPGSAGESLPAQVVVKIQRPHIADIIDSDMAALRQVGGWLQRYRPISRRANVPALMGEFTRTLYEEIDYLAEGQNAETFAKNFAEDSGVRVPGVVWSHTRPRVLTLEDVQDIKITDYAAIDAAGIDRAEVAVRLLNTYLKQIFEDNFFHADPHPGNLFIRPLPPAPVPADEGKPQAASTPAPWQLTFVDFGMVGRVPAKLRNGMREFVIALGTRDAARLNKSYQLLDVLLPGADLSLLQQAEQAAFDRFWGKSMTELQHISLSEMQDFAHQFRELIYNMPFQVPEDLILLGRAVGILSGMCTGLDPNFNVWEATIPFAQKLIAEDAASSRENWGETLTNLARKALALPGRTGTILEKIERGELSVRAPELSGNVQRLERAVRQAVWAVVFAALLLAGVQLSLASLTPWAQILLVGSGLSLVGVWWAGRR